MSQTSRAEPLHITIVPGTALSAALRQDIIALCTRAYEEDFADIMAAFTGATHVLGYLGDELVSHALWIPRTLTCNGAPLRCAYVEAVATEPRYQGRRCASSILRALAAAVTDYDLAALSPSEAAFYARLGWEAWRGPLAVLTAGSVIPTPDEDVMILRLPNTPPLDLYGMLVAPWREGDIW